MPAEQKCPRKVELEGTCRMAEKSGRWPDDGTKQRLLAAAADLFGRKGFEATSIREITEQAEANLAAINYHFRSKQALFAAVINQKIEPLKKRFRSIAQSSDSPDEKLKGIFREYAFYLLHEEPGLRAFFSDAIHGGKHLPISALEALEWRDEVVGKIIQDGVRKRIFRRCNVQHATWMLFGMLAPFILYQPILNPEYKRGPYPVDMVHKIVETALALYFHGIVDADGKQGSREERKASR